MFDYILILTIKNKQFEIDVLITWNDNIKMKIKEKRK